MQLHTNPEFSTSTSYTRAGAFYPDTLNAQFDASVMRDLWLRGQTDRALKVKLGKTPLDVGDVAEDQALVLVGGEIVGQDKGTFPVGPTGLAENTFLEADLALFKDQDIANGGARLITSAGIVSYAWVAGSSGPPDDDNFIVSTFVGAPAGNWEKQSDATIRSGGVPLSQRMAQIPLYVENYRADGFTDVQAIIAAIAAIITRGGVLEFERGREYDLGTISVETSLFAMAGAVGVTLRGGKLKINNPTSFCNIFYISDFEDVEFQDMYLNDIGYTGAFTNGAKLFVLDQGAGHSGKNIRFRNCKTDGANSFLTVQGGSGNRITDIYVEPTCVAKNTFYGLSFQNNGDNARGGLTVRDGGRAYFPYGVVNHDFVINNIETGSGPTSNASCLIKRYARDTKDIKLRVNYSGSIDNHASLVVLEHQNDSGAASIIDNIDVEINVEQGTTDTSGATRLLYRSYTDAGVENTGSVAHKTNNVRLSGDLGQSANPLAKANYTPTLPSALRLGQLQGLSPVDNFSLAGIMVFVDPNTVVQTKAGDLTSGFMRVETPGLVGYRFQLKVTIYAEPAGNNSMGPSSKSHYLEYIVSCFANAGSNNIGVVDAYKAIERGVNASDLTVTFGTTTNAVVLSFVSAADYIVSTAKARVKVEFLARQGQ